MAKVTRNPLPAPLRPEDLAGKKSAVCTVKDVKVDLPSPNTRRGKSTVLILVEFPDKGLYLNATSTDNCIRGFGSDESDEWVGKLVPIVAVQSEDARAATDPTIPKLTTKLWVATPEEWPTMLKGKTARAK